MYWDTFHAMTVHCSHYYYNMTHLKLQRVQDSAYWWQFLLCIVNISGIVSHEIPKYTISNTIYFDWRSRSFGFRSVFISNTLMIGLFRSNNRMVIFFLKQKKNSYHSKHVRDHTFMTSIWKVDVHIKGEVLKFVTCLYILFF